MKIVSLVFLALLLSVSAPRLSVCVERGKIYLSMTTPRETMIYDISCGVRPKFTDPPAPKTTPPILTIPAGTHLIGALPLSTCTVFVVSDRGLSSIALTPPLPSCR